MTKSLHTRSLHTRDHVQKSHAGIGKKARLLCLAFCLFAVGSHKDLLAAECGANYDELGSQVQAVYAALANPQSPESMKSIVTLGRDSRYYTMVRGWLTMQLEGDQSILAASGGDANPEIEARVEFLEQAIRAIDLE